MEQTQKGKLALSALPLEREERRGLFGNDEVSFLGYCGCIFLNARIISYKPHCLIRRLPLLTPPPKALLADSRRLRSRQEMELLCWLPDPRSPSPYSSPLWCWLCCSAWRHSSSSSSERSERTTRKRETLPPMPSSRTPIR